MDLGRAAWVGSGISFGGNVSLSSGLRTVWDDHSGKQTNQLDLWQSQKPTVDDRFCCHLSKVAFTTPKPLPWEIGGIHPKWPYLPYSRVVQTRSCVFV